MNRDQAPMMEREDYEPERIEAYTAQRDLKKRIIRARRWHAGAVGEIDHIMRAISAGNNKLTSEGRLYALERAGRDLAPFFAGVPGEPAAPEG